jgi:hypothetical protein
MASAAQLKLPASTSRPAFGSSGMHKRLHRQLHIVFFGKRAMYSPAVPFGGDSGPGTGLRHFPEDVPELIEEEYTPEEIASHEHHVTDLDAFPLKSTQECYEEFPRLVRASFPLKAHAHRDPVPAGEANLHAPDAGPLTGHRQRPPPVNDHPDRSKPRIPGREPAPEKLLREVATRRGC